MWLSMKKLVVIAGVCGFLIAIGALAIRMGDPLRSSIRRAWKEQAIAAISARVADTAWPGGELAGLKRRATDDPDDSDGWLSERLILMRNGDWLAYANVCRKQDGHIYDLFIGRGSDGQWYYSTYHFCVRMLVLRDEEQPKDIAGFANAYYLRNFDGHSDECLQKTWPPVSR
jgi:hypothetical protein